MDKRSASKFKLPPIRPEGQVPKTTLSVEKCETSISIPRDNVRLNPELDFIVEQKRNHDLCRKLQKKRNHAEYLREKLLIQWQTLEQSELTFQGTIVAHNKFLKRNLEKRERAIAKMQTDQELTKNREREIKALHQRYDFFDAIMQKMRQQIKRHSIYEDFLNSVMELDESPYKNEREFLTKYESLQLVKQHCIVRQKQEMATTVLLHDRNVEFFRLHDIVLVVTNRLEKSKEKLAHRRERYQHIVQKLSNQWAQLVYSENHLRNLVVTHNRFVRDNLEKRTRASARVQQNQRLIELRQGDINDLKKEMDIAHFLLSEFRREIGKLDVYDIFLTKLISNEDSPFRSVYELLKRYEMLVQVKAGREQEQNAEIHRVVRAHQNMKKMIYEGNVMVIGLRNDLNNLRCKFDDVCRKNLTTESLITSIVDRTNELNGEVSTCQHMIDAIYRYMCERRKLPHMDYPLREVKPKIDMLKSTLGGWAQIFHSTDIAKTKKKSRELRKSRMWRQSLSQGVFQWKRKPQQESTFFENLMKTSSIFRR